jgi:hypothetical protein
VLFAAVIWQVTDKLVTLGLQARERHATLADQEMVGAALAEWLALCMKIRTASPESRLSAVVTQQLQDSGLLQHLAVSMSEVADELGVMTARHSADRGDSSSGNSSSSSSSSGSTVPSTARMEDKALRHAQMLLQTYGAACTLLTPEGSTRLGLVGPPAAVATRLS